MSLIHTCLVSLKVEHSLCKRAVIGSIPILGFKSFYILSVYRRFRNNYYNRVIMYVRILRLEFR